MHCFCCEGEMSDARKIKIRRLRDFGPLGAPDSASYQQLPARGQTAEFLGNLLWRFVIVSVTIAP
jgi:hypothetical protein